MATVPGVTMSEALETSSKGIDYSADIAVPGDVMSDLLGQTQEAIVKEIKDDIKSSPVESEDLNQSGPRVRKERTN